MVFSSYSYAHHIIAIFSKSPVRPTKVIPHTGNGTVACMCVPAAVILREYIYGTGWQAGEVAHIGKAKNWNIASNQVVQKNLHVRTTTTTIFTKAICETQHLMQALNSKLLVLKFPCTSKKYLSSTPPHPFTTSPQFYVHSMYHTLHDHLHQPNQHTRRLHYKNAMWAHKEPENNAGIYIHIRNRYNKTNII